MMAELAKISKTVTDEKVQEKAIMAGIEPLVPIAQRILRPHRRNSRGSSTLDQSIESDYYPKGRTLQGKKLKEGVGVIGWDGDSYYGRFYEHGYRPITGTRKMIDGRLRWLPNTNLQSKHSYSICYLFSALRC